MYIMYVLYLRVCCPRVFVCIYLCMACLQSTDHRRSEHSLTFVAWVMMTMLRRHHVIDFAHVVASSRQGDVTFTQATLVSWAIDSPWVIDRWRQTHLGKSANDRLNCRRKFVALSPLLYRTDGTVWSVRLQEMCGRHTRLQVSVAYVV